MEGIAKCVPRQPKVLNEISQRFTHKYGPLFDETTPKAPAAESEETAESEVKYVSAIDSKPVRPGYLKLMSLTEFIDE